MMDQPSTKTSTPIDPARGGSATAIKHHYDASNAFYALWLDPTMTYSCALWEPGDDPDNLAAAQLRKLDYHLQAAGAREARRLLDIGCGWGALLERASAHPQLDRAVGLTLSDAQFDHIVARNLPRVEVRRESWIQHQPTAPYDGIISIGAFEHFARPSDTSAEKIDLYREFFEKCRAWLAPDGALSLQTIAFGTMPAAQGNEFITTHIFPEAQLPEPHEILQAAKGLFELISLRNDRPQYGRTCDIWFRNLQARRDEAVALVGEEKVKVYEKYLRLCSFAFRSGKVELLRMKFKASL